MPTLRSLLFALLVLAAFCAEAQIFSPTTRPTATQERRMRVLWWNVENLFDTLHDAGFDDREFLPESDRRWTSSRYWHKQGALARVIVAAGGMQPVHVVGMCEVENDSVLRDLTRRSLLRTARYEYVMTHSPDLRGIDVALLYSPFTFALIKSHTMRINPPTGMRPTRDILYAKGVRPVGDTLHIFVIHAPSRAGGEANTRPYRVAVAQRLCNAIDSIRREDVAANIIVTGDFNDYGNTPALQLLTQKALTDVSANAKGCNGAKGTYRYQGEWGSLDHVFVSEQLCKKGVSCRIFDAPFLMEDEEKYGGKRPWRTYQGPKYLGGFSDHLPLVVTFNLPIAVSKP